MQSQKNDLELQKPITESPLDKLLHYHIQERHLSPGYQVALGQCALVFIAAAGLLYSKPAADFADHEDLGLSKNTQVLFNVMDTCYSAFIVLCAATVFFYRFHVKPQQIPAELADIIEPPFTATEYLRKNVIIGAAAACSAVPFVTLAYVMYQSLPAFELIPLLIYIAVANTFLHFLPIKLILDDPFYGAPPRYLKKSVFECLGWKIQQKAPLDAEMQQQIGLLMAALNSQLANVMNDVPEATNKLAIIKNYTLQELLEAKAFPVVMDPPLTPREKQAARASGVFLVITSCIGYLANPYLVFTQVLAWTWWAAALITALPMFFLGVLFTYFGDTMGQQIWADIKADARYIYRCYKQDPANPPVFLQTTIFKLYPTAAFACMALNVFLAMFSAAAAMEMIHYAFANLVSKEVLLALYVIAQIGVSIVALYAPLDYQKMLMTYYALYFDEGPRHDIIMFQEGIASLQGDLFRLKSASSNESLVQTTEKSIDTHAEGGAESKSTNCLTTWCSSWCRGNQKNKSEFVQPLLS